MTRHRRWSLQILAERILLSESLPTTYILPEAKPCTHTLNFPLECHNKMAERRKGGFIVNNSDSVCSSEGGSLVKWNVSIWQEQHFSALPSSVLEECMRRKRESDRWRIGKVLSEGTEGAYGSTVVLCCVKWNAFHHISPSLQSHSRAKQQPEHWLVLRRLFRHWTLRHGYKNVQKHFVLFCFSSKRLQSIQLVLGCFYTH